MTSGYVESVTTLGVGKLRTEGATGWGLEPAHALTSEAKRNGNQSRRMNFLGEASFQVYDMPSVAGCVHFAALLRRVRCMLCAPAATRGRLSRLEMCAWELACVCAAAE